MSSSKVRLEVTAADAATELYVIDGDFNLVDRGIGSKVFAVTPGIYKIKARSGIQQEERLVIVRGDEKVEFGPLPFVSAVPLENTAGTTPEQIEMTRRAVADVDLRLGQGSSIVVLLLGAPKKMQLRGMDGSALTDVVPHMQLDPGGYRLAIELPDGRTVEQTLVAAPGWQTRVFLSDDLAHTAVSMRSEGTPFDPYDTEARLEEIARQAIGHGRKVLSSELRARIAAENVSPMLGILGMHLLIREAKRNKEAREQNPTEAIPEVNNIGAVQNVIANLRATIGRHPDVEAIAIGAGVADPAYTFDVPPMLTASWRLLLKASAQQPELIPRGSLGEQVAMRLWGDGAWLQWLDPATDPVDREAAWQANAKRMLIYLEQAAKSSGYRLAAQTPAPERKKFNFGDWVTRTVDGFVKKNPKYTPIGEFVRESVEAADEGVFQAQRLRLRLDGSARRKLVKQLGIPMAAIDAWIAGGEKKP
jgi:hypothetical protein